jgi:hypothetical protein
MEYEKPTVIDYGKITDLTAGQTNGNFTDKAFPVHFPKDQLTFS